MTTSERQSIGLNAHLLNLSGNYRSAGINWYIYHLLKHLPTSEFDYTIFSSESRARSALPNLRLIQSELPTHNPVLRIVWEQTMLPYLLRQERIALLHGMAFAGPIATSIPWVATVYDLSFIYFPKLFNRANRMYLKWAVGHSARHAARLIAISESTKRDLASCYRVSPDKIAVVHCGVETVDSTEMDQRDINMLRQRHNLPDHFILHVGTIEPRKNVVRLIRAFARARKQANLPHRLVLVGARGWKYDQVDSAIEEEGIAPYVSFAGYIPQDELPLWYRAADLFVYPSLYEGFGLPPLEAMAFGTPVVASNSSSIPEVVGDAALVVPPTDENALADSIVIGLTNHALRDQLIDRGLQRTRHFSWARAAEETVGVYRDALKSGGVRATP